MKFAIRGTALYAACDEAGRFIQAAGGLGLVELFSLEGLRTLAQNAKMWPMLTDISRQVEWYGGYHDADTWKHIITAAWKGQHFVHGLGGSMVVIPVRTSRLRKKEFAELIEAIYAFGAEKGVQWSEPALKSYEQYREAA